MAGGASAIRFVRRAPRPDYGIKAEIEGEELSRTVAAGAGDLAARFRR